MSVPRFTDEMLAPLKRVMLSCAPGFSLGPEHVQALAQETGLVKAQVQKWAENFRRRYVTEKERVDFLTTEGCEKVSCPPLIFGPEKSLGPKHISLTFLGFSRTVP